MSTRARFAPLPRARAVALLAVVSLACGGGAGGEDGRASIGPGGGAVALDGGPRLEVPAGALDVTTALSIERTAALSASGTPVFRLGPDGTTFDLPVTITLPLPPGLDAPALYWSRPGSASDYDVLPATITADGVRAEGTHFSSVFVGPSSGAAVCAAAGPGSDGEPCGEGRRCVAGACGASLSGTIGGTAAAGVTVLLGGAATASTTTDGAGRWVFSGLADGSYTVTPSLDGHAFDPPSAAAEVSAASRGDLDFEAWRPVLSAVSPAEGRVGATVTLTGSRLGAAGGGTATLGGQPMEIVSWSSQQIVARVPAGGAGGALEVQVAGGRSDPLPFVVTAGVSGLLVDGSPSAALAGSWAFGGDGAPAQLVVSALGTGRSAIGASVPGSGYGGMPRAFSLELPVGAHLLAVQDLDAAGQATMDLLQAASREPHPVVVPEEGLTGLELPLRWHWEVHALDPGFPVCDSARQLHFRDADHGFVTFQVNAGVDPEGPADRIHAMVMATSDGGRTWTVASHDASSESPDFRPTAPGWFPTGFLLALDDGTVLSLGDNGQLVRSADAGATWHQPSLSWAAAGPGGASPTRFARSADTLYVSVSTGGVQSSRERSQLLASTDAGATWQRIFDVCAPSHWIPGGCPTQGVPLGFAGVDMACSDLDPRQCVTMGYDHDALTSVVLVTRDGFQTHEAIAPECGYFTHGQVIWLPGTDDAWVVGASSCPGVGTRAISTTDGGATWSGWAPSPFPGRAAFADASNALAWWDWGVRATRDGGATWRYTGRAPAAGGALRSVHVLDAEHAWVLGSPDCRTSGAAVVARWVP